MIESQFGLLSIFLLSLFNQIIIPAPVDIILFGMVKVGFNPLLLILATTTGMTIGATCDYVIGKFGIETIPLLKKETHTKFYKKAENFYQKYGKWSLLVTFFPFIGKYFPAVAGLMRERFITFISLFVLGKIVYYFVLFFLISLI